jgi:hypothetical protein
MAHPPLPYQTMVREGTVPKSLVSGWHVHDDVEHPGRHRPMWPMSSQCPECGCSRDRDWQAVKGMMQSQHPAWRLRPLIGAECMAAWPWAMTHAG